MKKILKEITPPLLWRNLQKLISVIRNKEIYQLDIEISQCVHYSGFRYGCNDFNPYEIYLNDLQQGLSIQKARSKFIDFLQYYRPHHMGEILGINLSRKYPMFVFPWMSKTHLHNKHQYWCRAPDDCEDIMTHFCESGILSFRIDEEFLWLDRIFYSISKKGYIPNAYKLARMELYPSSTGPFQQSPLRTCQFVRKDGQSAFLVLDGNHRISSLAVLGYQTVSVHQMRQDIIYEADCENWSLVKNGYYSPEDALKVFHRYFQGNSQYRTTDVPCTIIASYGWESLYEINETSLHQT